jgi:hypothetical protein
VVYSSSIRGRTRVTKSRSLEVCDEIPISASSAVLLKVRAGKVGPILD